MTRRERAAVRVVVLETLIEVAEDASTVVPDSFAQHAFGAITRAARTLLDRAKREAV